MKKVSLWQIFITFFKTGLFTFGGGYAMIAILEEELVSKKNWITSQDMLDMLVIAESTPGVIAVNTATSVGYKLRGVLGAIIATLGVVLPSFVIITALSFVIELVADNKWYNAAFQGVQACVMVLILNAFIKMSKNLQKDWFNVVLVIAAFTVATLTKFNVIFLILIGGVLGLSYTLIKEAVLNKKKARASVNESGSAVEGEVKVDNAEQSDALAQENSTAEQKDDLETGQQNNLTIEQQNDEPSKKTGKKGKSKNHGVDSENKEDKQ